MRFKVDPYGDTKKFVFYVLRDEKDIPIYAGVTFYCQLFVFRDAKDIPIFHRMYRDKTLFVEILGVYGDKMQAINARAKWFREFDLPHVNKFEFEKNLKNHPIVCLDTMKVYRSAEECARTEKINKGQLSCHLSLRYGYETVHGKTYVRLSAVPLHTDNSAVPLHKLKHKSTGRIAYCVAGEENQEFIYVKFEDLTQYGWIKQPRKIFQ